MICKYHTHTHTHTYISIVDNEIIILLLGITLNEVTIERYLIEKGNLGLFHFTFQKLQNECGIERYPLRLRLISSTNDRIYRSLYILM